MTIYSRQPNQTKQADCEVIEQLKKGILNLDKSNEEVFATLLKLVKWRGKKFLAFFLFLKQNCFLYSLCDSGRKESSVTI